jgi:putative ABC transport system permease protein
MQPRAFARLFRRLRLLLGRRAFERDVEDELRFHMEMVASRHAANGLSPTDVYALTHKEFGSMNRYKEEVRDARGLTLVDDVWRDVRFAFRTLRRTPGFTIIALITFALGIGANTAIFSVVNTVLLRPLPYPNASRLVQVAETIKDYPEPGAVSVINFLDWKKQNTSFEGLGAYYNTFVMLNGDGEPERAREGIVSTNIIPMLGVKPMLGRVFASDEEVKGKQHVVLLSDHLWRNRYGADPNLVGRTILLEGVPYTVVGIMPAGFNFPAGPRVVDLWAPFVPPDQALDPRSRGWHWISVIGLVKPGVSIERADQEMKQIARRLQIENPISLANRSTKVMSVQESLVGNVRPVLLVLLGAVFLVLLIACANVANLLLARNAARRKDVAVRVALGASRGQLARQFLVESVVLALMGALLGLGVARFALRVLTIAGQQALPIAGPITLDGRVLLALVGAAVLCGIAFGIAPALQLSTVKVRGGLADLTTRTTQTGEMRRFRSGLVVAQIALSLMLLIGAGLLMRGFVALHATDPGLVSDHVFTARVAVPRRLLRTPGEETTLLLRPLLEHVRAIPGVRAAGVSTMLPIEQSGATASFWIDRKPWPAGGNEPLIEVRSVSPGFLATLGIKLKAGRDFTEADDSTGVRKIIVNEAVVRRLLPGESPIGRRLLQGNPQRYDEFEIIGVAGDVKQSGLDVPASPELYTSYADPRIDWNGGDVSLLVKTAVPELSIVPQVRAAVKDVARDVAVLNIRPMDEVIEQSLASRKLTLMLFAIFAAVALALAASGLYGVIYYLVTQRTREIGIRVALGAQTSRVVAMVVGQGAILIVAGLVVGTAGALLLSRLLRGMLYGVGTHDPLTFAAVPLVLAAVAFLATLVPARKAAGVDPVIALREE